MDFTEQEVRQYVEQEDVRFIRLAFCDVFGKQKNIAILPTELDRAFRHGIAIDASAIAGFGGEVRSDLFLHPDPATLASLPWRGENGKVVRMFCGVAHPDGTTLETDSRALLRKAVERAAKRGISFAFGTEMEFYLFKTDEDGEPTKIPFDRAGYMDIAPMDKGENVRREICLTLSQMGIQPECSHHEEGPGQNEIDFRYSGPLAAADNALTFRAVVEAIVARNGLAADFSPKPLPDQAGNGMHINISVDSRDGRDLLGQGHTSGRSPPFSTRQTIPISVSAAGKRLAISPGRVKTAPSSSASLRRRDLTSEPSCALPIPGSIPIWPLPF